MHEHVLGLVTVREAKCEQVYDDLQVTGLNTNPRLEKPLQGAKKHFIPSNLCFSDTTESYQ